MIVAFLRWLEQASELFCLSARGDLYVVAAELSAARGRRSAQPVRWGHLPLSRLTIMHGIH